MECKESLLRVNSITALENEMAFVRDIESADLKLTG